MTDSYSKLGKELFSPYSEYSEIEKAEVEFWKSKIDNALAQNNKLSFEQLCNEVGFDIKEFLSLTEFDRRNTLYQALVWHFRNIEKRDFHCHLGMGIGINELASLIITSDGQDFHRIIKSLVANSIQGKRHIATKILTSLPQIILKNSYLLKLAIRISGVQRNWKTEGFYIVSPQVLYKAVLIVSKNYIKDGVVSFSLRLNPFKEYLFPGLTTATETFKATMTAVIDALDEAALNNGLDANQLTIFLSLNRESDQYNLKNCEELFQQWENIPKRITTRVKGLDLAGPEGNLNPKMSINNWNPILNALRQKNLEFSPHIGDIRNLQKDSDLYRSWIEYISDGSESIGALLELVKKHYKFLREYLLLMSEGSSIAHGISISSRILFLKPIDPLNPKGERKIYVLDLEQKLETAYLEDLRISLLNDLIGLKKLLIEKNIPIYFCPTATTKSYNLYDFSELPLYEWLINDGIKVKIGIDGIFQYPKPKTLSEELAKVFIIKSPHYRALNYGEVISLIK